MSDTVPTPSDESTGIDPQPPVVSGGPISPARGALLSRASRLVDAFPDLPISPPLTEAIDARDAALVRASEQVLLRHWRAIGAMLRTCSTRPARDVEPGLRGALFAATAQMCFLDRVPHHAIVHETVDWVDANVRMGAGAFANAVLRRVQALIGDPSTERVPASEWLKDPRSLPMADGRVRRLATRVFARGRNEGMSEQTSLAEGLCARWRERLGDDRAERVMAASLCQSPVVLMGVDPDSLPGELRALTTPHARGGLVFHGDDAQLSAALQSGGRYARVQDPASSLAVASADGLGPRRILDLCAGRGTKTMQLLHAHPDAEVVACDTDAARLDSLRSRLAEGGFEKARAVTFDEALATRQRYDLILLDVPCSNSGVLSRRLEARYRWSGRTISSLLRVQKEIAFKAIRVLEHGGHLLWSTCSIDSEENEHMVEELGEMAEFETESMATSLPAGEPGAPPETIANGSFHALLRRAD